jgi:hypothetical protein
MSFSKTWNESLPAGSENTNTGDDRIREFKYAIRERLGIDHNALATEAVDGTEYYHKLIHLIEQATPAAIANIGQLYTKDVAGAVGLFFMNGAGVEIRLTDSLVTVNSVVGSTDISTTANVYVDMPGMTWTDTFSAGNVLIQAKLSIGIYTTSGLKSACVALLIDDVVVDTDSMYGTSSYGGPISLTLLYSGAVTAASHTIKIQWKTTGGTASQSGSVSPRVMVITKNLN